MARLIKMIWRFVKLASHAFVSGLECGSVDCKWESGDLKDCILHCCYLALGINLTQSSKLETSVIMCDDGVLSWVKSSVIVIGTKKLD